jgi:Lantibiotic dehydratase, N terminus
MFVDRQLITTVGAGGWGWFPWGVLRSAGFPIRSVETLRSDALLLAADSLLAADREVARVARELCDHSATVGNRSQHRRIRRAVHSRRAIGEALCTRNAEHHVRAWNDRLEQRTHAAGTFHRAYRQERLDSTQRLLKVFEADGIRRAMLWQNRRVLPFLLKSKDSWDERVLLKYITRYATKNDSIGFFGPVAWIRVSSEPGFARLRWGPAITRATRLSFEVWPIALIGERLAEQKSLRPWLSPRRSALCRLQNRLVFMPPDCPVDASVRDIDILQLCDGHRTALEISEQLALDDLERFDALHQAGLITWTLECPLRTNPESTIEELAARIDDHEVRAAVELHSTWLVSAIDRLRQGMETSTSLATALADIDSEFEQRYSREAVQGSGQYYAGRTLTYIDCERDVSLTLNAGVMNSLMQGLAPILLSLRWYTYTIVQQLLSSLAAVVPFGQTSPLVKIFPHALSLVWSTIQQVAARYREKWQNLLLIDPLHHVVRLDAVRLAAAVATEFSAPYPGWPLARVHNPDVLIAARDHRELANGQCTVVLGEVHASLPSMFQAAVFSLCPEPDSVRDLFFSLVTPPLIINEVSQRLNLGVFFSSAAQLLLPDDPVTHVHARPIADFDICHDETGLRVKDVTTDRLWSVPVFFDAMLSRATFHIDPFDRSDAVHSPRIVVGDLVVARERWRMTAAAFGITERRRANPEDNSNRFLAVRKWVCENGVPRYVFAKSLKEPKPVFLDLESQKCVELLVHLLKQAAAGDSAGLVTISEMLPEPDRCWLRDAAGNGYTSEIRLLAVDPIPYPQREQPVAEFNLRTASPQAP